MPDCPFLTRCAEGFEDANRAFDELTAEMTGTQANWRPEPGRWSVAECVEHLNVAGRLYFPKMERAIRRGRERQILGQAPFERRSFLGRMILSVLEPGSGKRVKAPKIFRPKKHETLDLERLGEEFRANLRRFGELAEEADGLALDLIRLASPIAPFPRLTLAEAFQIHVLHIPRHLEQAKKVIESPGFPGADPK